MADPRELTVTVTLRIPLAKVIDMYADAVEQGFTQTLNAWIEDYAYGVIEDMEHVERVVTDTESSWRISEAVTV